MYFGLQTGWITMGSLQSAILGYCIFALLSKIRPITPLSAHENVVIQVRCARRLHVPLNYATAYEPILAVIGCMFWQTTAVAAATMPLERRFVLHFRACSSSELRLAGFAVSWCGTGRSGSGFRFDSAALWSQEAS